MRFETIGYVDGSTGLEPRMKSNIDYMNGYRKGLSVYLRFNPITGYG